MPLDARRNTVLTGTDMAILMGAVTDAWGTPYDVYLSKVGLAAPLVMTHRMAMGQLAEPYIAFFYQKEHVSPDCELQQGEFTMHPLLMLGGTPDRLITKDGKPIKGLEIKKVGYRQGWGEAGSDEVPLKVRVQCQHYMTITGLTEWDVAAMIEEDDIRVYTLRHDPVLEHEMMLKAQEFWSNHVIPKVPPERGKAPMDEVMVKLAKSGSSVVDPDDPVILALGKEANKLKISSDALKEKLDDVLKQLKEYMASKNYRGVSHGWSANLIGVNPKPKTDWETVALGMAVADKERFDALVGAHTERPNPTTRFQFKAKELPTGEE